MAFYVASGNRFAAIGCSCCYSDGYYSGMELDNYLIDTLMRDLVQHDRSPASFLVYLYIYRQTHGEARAAAAISYAVLAEATGLSKRSVQSAVGRLLERRLIRKRQPHPTSTPIYTALTPWIRVKARA
jgi:DNA-binding MarR family transcriptional regulator